MQRSGRRGPKATERPCARRWLCRALAAAFCSLAIGSGLSACIDNQSFERDSDGSTIYLDQLSEPAKAEARHRIEEALARGISAYRLGIGDEFDVLFHENLRPTARRYAIAPGDKLRIDILGDTENSGAVQVLPDGRVALPLIGAVKAAGLSPEALAQQLQQRYGRVLSAPKITVNVATTHSPREDFLAVLGPSEKTRVLADKVLPDGTVALPLLPSLPALGKTLPELAGIIDAGYAAKGIDITVSLLPRTLRANAALVIGEVGKPGRIELVRPTTVAMAVAQAGGVSSAGDMDAVRLFYIAEDGAPRVRSINLTGVLEGFRLEDDMIVPRNSIIYVPPTALAKTGRFMSTVMRDILRFQGFSIGGGYNIQ